MRKRDWKSRFVNPGGIIDLGNEKTKQGFSTKDLKINEAKSGGIDKISPAWVC
jgi:hypothetical protein